jgi:cysteine desulfurase
MASSMAARIYLDHNATAPLCAPAREAVLEALDRFGNPSSVHEEGRAARDVIERARRDVAALIGGDPMGVVFTSGGTEADCLGIVGLARLARDAGRPPVVAAPAIEHPAVHGALRALVREGFEVATLPVDGDAVIDPDALAAACARGVAVVALSLANHELGTIQDVAACVAIAREHGALVHCDAVQAAGKLPFRVEDLGVDALAISGHKFGAPKGVGALWVAPRHDLASPFEAGHQERARRGGTENVAGIAGMGAAAGDALDVALPVRARVEALTARVEEGALAIGGVRVHGRGAPRVGNTACLGIDGALGESVVAALDLAGFAASTGAACTSGSVAPSPVLLALGLPPERAVEAVRLSLGPATTAEEIDALLAALPGIVARARAFR